jgi:hypothetical protein
MRIVGRAIGISLLLALLASLTAGAEVILLKGGVRIELKKPPVRQGNVVLLTRADGTLLSVPASEVDWKATAAAKASASARPAPAVTAPPESLAQAAKASGRGPKARIKLTDADVSHSVEEASDSGEKKEPQTGPARLDVADYSQEKTGTNLTVHGSLHNSGGAAAVNSRMTVTALDEKGDQIASGEAGLSKAVVDPGGTVSFSVTIPVAERFVGTIRFAPQWSTPPVSVAAPVAAPTPAASEQKQAAQNPTPAPTPFGRGTLYAPPAAPASTTPSADGNRGYIPGMSSPENQPKPPN